MKESKPLTNAHLRGKIFQNNFQLVNFAISIARGHIREDDGKTLSQLLKELSQIIEKESYLPE